MQTYSASEAEEPAKHMETGIEVKPRDTEGLSEAIPRVFRERSAEKKVVYKHVQMFRRGSAREISAEMFNGVLGIYKMTGVEEDKGFLCRARDRVQG